MSERWLVLMDRGGTFTDAIAIHPLSLERRVIKVLSSDAAPIHAVRRLLNLQDDDEIPPIDLRMGTTLATNALLERKGERCALVITRGFGDAFEIGHQNRPEIFALSIDKPQRLYREVLEVESRSGPQGEPLARDLDLSTRLEELRARGVQSLAIVVLHGHAAPELEVHLRDLAREAGFTHVSVSHEAERRIGLIGRGNTCVVDAYLTPVLTRYLEGLLDGLPQSRLLVMQSSGGLCAVEHFRGHNAILSGPAGGVVALMRLSEYLQRPLIGLDMGGTSTDVSRFEGELLRRYETEISGVKLRAPMLDVHTIAAGGGSICSTDGERLIVGPQSAGAEPGPLVYGHSEASELTLTDVAFVLGRVLPDRFPLPLDSDRALQALERIAADLEASGVERSSLELAEGFFCVAGAQMAEAIRKVSTARGRDPRNFGLLVYGGAGGQHACDLARRLGIQDVYLHPLGGALSALGMGLAPLSWHGERDLGGVQLDASALEAMERAYGTLEVEGRQVLAGLSGMERPTETVKSIDLRYAGTEAALNLTAEPDADALEAAFAAMHAREFGYTRPGHTIEAVTARMEVLLRSEVSLTGTESRADSDDPRPKKPVRHTRLWYAGAFLEDVPVWRREDLPVNVELTGPLIVLEETGTVVVDPGFRLVRRSDDLLHLRVTASDPTSSTMDSAAKRDPVLLEIMNQRYMAIAEQMGEVLRRTALSTNIRDRLDFSCAVFDRDGGLIANAPHIPVHLGAMGESVRAVRALHPSMSAGDVFATNDPAAGGSHLPDITVVSPFFVGDTLRFFVANRGHHADVGGITPGSMPAFSSSIEEEGVVLRALRVVSSGAFDEHAVRAALASGLYPARSPDQNVQDLLAQIAANRTGLRLLQETIEEHGLSVVEAYMQHVRDNASMAVSKAIAELEFEERRFEDHLDDGTSIVVTARVREGRLSFDFSGTGAEVDGNLNAPRAVTLAAVLYVVRLMVGVDIPLNHGSWRDIDVILPEGSILSPGPGRAVAGGNVETSQRVVDVLLGALGLSAASQGTMNNLSFGNERFGYYETLGGGAGAGPWFHGASAVHTHMTNTRLTDPEVLERRFPVRVREMSVRRGSGGRGRYTGGDGLVRELEFLEPVTLSILSERRVRAPFGLCGGGPGQLGRNLLNGQSVGGKAERSVRAKDVLRIETPGGGGYGSASGTPE